ncbi:uncharacterized protein LOC141646880 [Silene latifolia]|uniref:uncharacterized protein LOC141646880 n=1 Tax=Silene latifolia TaxID=37657 RepID=UPI003D77EEA4
MAEIVSLETTIIEERVEFMVDPATSEVPQNPTERTGYFLKPSLNLNALPPKLPKIQSFSSSSNPNVLFLCHSTPLKGWITWVEKLRQTHEPEWRKAGIFDAIKGSTYHIAKITDLILSLVEKWCPETNTFVFPWGEATVTLEDVYVLGGFSPLGVSVSSNSSCLGDDVQQVENKLIMSYRKLKDKCNSLTQLRWQEHFMGCGDELEYAGFLSLWLARHVFPGRSLGAVPQSVFIMAARISCGAKLAFGPVVLASIYRDLTLLKKEVLRSVRGQCNGDSPVLVLSPLHLVQVWAWERFPLLGPVPRMIDCGEVRLARWESHVRKLCDEFDVDMCLDSARENFRWRPYGMVTENWSLPRFYVNSGMWVVVDSDEDWKLFARCLMVGQLWGFDCVQNYNPHRVALQFGFDQDIPESIDICKSSELDCVQNFAGLKLYLPPRLHEGDITSRYFDWWRTGLGQELVLVGCKRKLRTRKRVKRIAKSFDTSDGENSREISPPRDEFSPDLLQICYDIGMEEDEEEELGSTNRCMNDCNKTNISCSKLAGIDQKEGGMEQAEMLLERKQDCDAMYSVCSQLASKHENLDDEIEQVMVRCPLIRSEGALGKSERGVKLEMKSEYLEANIFHVKKPTESNGACKDAPDEALCQDPDTNDGNIPVNSQVTASLPVMDKSDQKSFAARCLEYQSRMNRLERVISALSVYKPT